MKLRKSQRGFTLVELLVVMGIMVSLGTLLAPALTKAQVRAQTLVCASNLRQIGVATLLYAAEHDQTLPKIEPWPAEPIYQTTDGAESIVTALDDYGIGQSQLKCALDLRGPNYWKKEGSSYCWCPMANGQRVNGTKANWAGPGGEVTLAQLFMCYDYSAVHNGESNVLFADGHVAVGD